MRKLRRAGDEGQGIRQFYNYFWELWWDESYPFCFEDRSRNHMTLFKMVKMVASGNQNGPWAVLERNFMCFGFK